MNRLLLAPDVQEAILFLPRTDGLHATIGERYVRPIGALPDWLKQRRMWEEMVGLHDSGIGDPTHRTTG